MLKRIRDRKMEERTCGCKAKVSLFDFIELELTAIFFPLVRMLPISRGIRNWIRGLLKEPRETAGGTLRQTESQTRNVFSSVERRLPVSKGLWETAKGHCPGRHA